MIVNVRGPSGSGKSWVGFQLFEKYGPWEERRDASYFTRDGVPRRTGKITHHHSKTVPGLALAGRYVMKTSTIAGVGVGYSGGVDGYMPMEDLTRMVDDLANEYEHVYLEGLLVSSTYARWHDFALRYPGRVAFVTLETPLAECLARVQARNKGTPVREDQIVKHRNQVLRNADWFDRDATSGDPLRAFRAGSSGEALRVTEWLFGLREV